jgi:chemotaxis protein histidine kinase CheA
MKSSRSSRVASRLPVDSLRDYIRTDRNPPPEDSCERFIFHPQPSLHKKPFWHRLFCWTANRQQTSWSLQPIPADDRTKYHVTMAKPKASEEDKKEAAAKKEIAAAAKKEAAAAKKEAAAAKKEEADKKDEKAEDVEDEKKDTEKKEDDKKEEAKEEDKKEDVKEEEDKKDDDIMDVEETKDSDDKDAEGEKEAKDEEKGVDKKEEEEGDDKEEEDDKKGKGKGGGRKKKGKSDDKKVDDKKTDDDKDEKKREASEEGESAGRPSRSKRARKTAETFTPDDFIHVERDLPLVQGRGKRLGEIPAVKKSIESRSISSEDMVMAHKFLYTTRGKPQKKLIKGNLLAYHGFLPKREPGTDDKKLEELDEEAEVRNEPRRCRQHLSHISNSLFLLQAKMGDKAYKLTVPQLKKLCDLFEIDR